MNTDPLDRLLEQLNGGDPAAAEQVFRDYEPYLRMLVRRQLRPALRRQVRLDGRRPVGLGRRPRRGPRRRAGTSPTAPTSGRSSPGWPATSSSTTAASTATPWPARSRSTRVAAPERGRVGAAPPQRGRPARRALGADARPLPAGPPRAAPAQAAGPAARRDRRADRPARGERPPHPLRPGRPRRRGPRASPPRPPSHRRMRSSRRADGSPDVRDRSSVDRQSARLRRRPRPRLPATTTADPLGDAARRPPGRGDGRRLAGAASGRGPRSSSPATPSSATRTPSASSTRRPASARRRARRSVSDRDPRPVPPVRRRLELLLDCNRLLRTPAGDRLPGGRRGPRRLPPPGRDRPRCAGRTFLASQRSLADRPVVLEGHAARATRSTSRWPGCSTCTSSRSTSSRSSPTGTSGSWACPTSAARRSPGSSTALRDVPAAQRTGRQVLDALDRSRRGPADRDPGRRAVPEVPGDRRPTSRPSAGSGPAWPTPSSTPTTAAWSTWTSSRRTS